MILMNCRNDKRKWKKTPLSVMCSPFNGSEEMPFCIFLKQWSNFRLIPPNELGLGNQQYQSTEGRNIEITDMREEVECFDAVGWATGRASGMWKVLPQQCSWFTVTAWWQRTVFKSETLSLSQGRLSWSRKARQPMQLSQRFWPILAAWWNTVILKCFDAIGWQQERHLACEKSCHNGIPGSPWQHSGRLKLRLSRV